MESHKRRILSTTRKQNIEKNVMPKILDTMCFPLHGARLIEASAGTGKTFTISGLYLRLLLGHGDEQSRHPTPLSVDQILVVTFTEAATAELRERIRRKIHDARIAFLRKQADQTYTSDDPVIELLLLEIADTSSAIKILLKAERAMDEAAIFTIHGFCQRMLTQNAFESGSRFNNDFITDESKMKAQVVADYWRRNFYSLSIDLAKEVRTLWASPQHLLKEISGYLTGVPISFSVEPMASSLQALHLENLASINKFKQVWLESAQDISNIISDSDVSKRSFTKRNLPAWIDSVTTWAEAETSSYQFPDKLEKFAQEFLAEKTPQGKRSPQHPLFHEVSEILKNKPTIREPLLVHAIETCRARLRETKQQKRLLSFDDLLTNLSAAIDTDSNDTLTDRIRQLYPVAMIDEFQDTDPLQYSIFSRIYLGHENTGLFMIGDPKQAIYAFRGADIFTYIRARNEVSDHYTLGTNWRSSADMIAATNRLFEAADSPFMYHNDIPFYPVNGSPSAELRGWRLEGKSQRALTYWKLQSEEPVSKTDYLDSMALGTANKINQILNSSEKGQAAFIDSSGKALKIRASNIAVLVRTGSEAKLVRQELAKLGVASVYLSNRDSVFKSSIATAILRLLQAVLNPEDERLLRAALASDILLRSSKSLDSLNENEMALENKVNAFKSFRLIWQQKGVMPMLRTIMSAEQIAENVLEQEFGERLVTDFLHIAELLQRSSLTLDSDYALVRWLAESIQEAREGGSTSDEQIQRLESERNLVQIVTIHKSKGLEYDLVFVPFASSYRESKSGQYYDQQQKQTVWDIKKSDQAIAISDRERLAEDLRLLYVAVTRAVYGCFIGVAPLRRGRTKKDPTSAHLSAIGYLLQNGEEGTTSEFTLALNRHVSSEPTVIECADISELLNSLEREQMSEQIALFDHSEPKDHHDLKAREMTTQIDRNWRITSYSGLVKQGQHRVETNAQYEIESQSTGLDVDSALEKDRPQVEEVEANIFSFPRGARPGTFLHTIFEQIDYTLPAHSQETQEIVSQLLKLEQYDEAWLPILQNMIAAVLETPLNGEGLRLQTKGEADKLVEMEFLLPIEHLSSVLFNQLNKRYDLLSSHAQNLGFSDVSGMLKGFIDLVFVHDGKYYVLDWKSNHLGDQSSEYSKQALENAIVEHRYDFQYQIYALALHRYLRSRIEDYRYETHFGGVYYLFLRGIDGSENGIFYNCPDREFIAQFDRLVDGNQMEVIHA